MAFWRVEFSKEAYKSYQDLPRGYKAKINKVLSLLVNRERVDLKPVKGESDVYRLRIGKYRMLINVDKKEKVILVVRIGPRGDIYKG